MLLVGMILVRNGSVLYCRQVGTVTEEFMNESALGFDGDTLLHDEHGHQPIGKQE
jgi:hypothetical protein